MTDDIPRHRTRGGKPKPWLVERFCEIPLPFVQGWGAWARYETLARTRQALQALQRNHAGAQWRIVQRP